MHLFTYLKNNCDLKPPTSPPTHSRVLSPVEDVGAPPAPLTPVRVEVRLGEALLSSPSTHSVSRVERPAGSLEGADCIFLFGRRRGRPCVAAASGGGLSGWLITMFPPSADACIAAKWKSRPLPSAAPSLHLVNKIGSLCCCFHFFL